MSGCGKAGTQVAPGPSGRKGALSLRLTPKNELEYRYRRLQQEMARSGLDAVLMLQKADLFYFTGTIQAGALYVPASGDPLFLVQRDFMRGRMESALKEVHPLAELKELPGRVADFGHGEPKNIGFELDVVPVNLFERLRALYPRAGHCDATPLIRRVRMVKSHYEIHILQDAAQQADKVQLMVRQALRPGMSEVELAAELERGARREGHQGVLRVRAFNGELAFARVLSGTDAATPSSGETVLGGMGLTPALGQGAGYCRIAQNETVLVEFVGCFDGYCVSQSRTVSLKAPPERLKRGYQEMVGLQRGLLELAGQGESWEAIYRWAVAQAARLGYGESFLGAAGARSPYVGHGIGIEVDELPLLGEGFADQRIETGMVFTLEPKVVFPGEGAAGIENTYYLSEQGVKQLTFSDEELLIL